MSEISFGLENRAILVSGGARPGGISQCIVEYLAKEGAKVAFMDVDSRGKDFAHHLRVGSSRWTISNDLRFLRSVSSSSISAGVKKLVSAMT